MKHLFLSAIALTFSAAQAGELPSVMPDGKYSFECTYVSVFKFAGSDTNRNGSLDSGTMTVKTENGVYTETSVSVQQDDDMQAKITYNTESTSTLKALAKDYYLRTTTSKWTSKVEYNDTTIPSVVRDSSETYLSTIRVDGGFETNLNVQTGSGPVKPGYGEAFYKLLPSGEFQSLSYIREAMVEPASKTDNGDIPEQTRFVNTNFCRYTPVK